MVAQLLLQLLKMLVFDVLCMFCYMESSVGTDFVVFREFVV